MVCLLTSLLLFWALCSFIKVRRGVINRASRSWRKILSLPLVLACAYGAYQDTKLIHEGRTLNPEMVAYTQNWTGPDKTHPQTKISGLSEKWDITIPQDIPFQAWLDDYPQLWEKNRGWQDFELIRLVQGTNYPSRLFFDSPPTTAELETIVRLSFCLLYTSPSPRDRG